MPEQTQRHRPLTDRTVATVLQEVASRTPDKLAVRDETQTYTYAELIAAATCMGGGYRQVGVGRQDRVLLMLDNDCDYVVCWLGLSLMAAVEVPINTAYKESLLSYLINDSGATTIVIDEAYLDRLKSVAADLEHLTTVVVRGDLTKADLPDLSVFGFEQLRTAESIEIEHTDPWDLIAVMYTSGTTGPSKGVLVTHGHAYSYCTPHYWNAAASDDVALVALPLFHVGGQWAGVYNALIAGASAVIVPRFSATTYWEDVRRFGCTFTLILGAMATFLYGQPPDPADKDNPMRRAIVVPVLPEVREFEERFGLLVGTAYGMTETASVILAPYGEAIPAGCGWVREDYEARIVDANDMEVERGAVGELVLRPREQWSIMAGYLNKPEATAQTWRNLWFHTGDAFRQDENDQYYFVDRTKDAIRRRGENVSSFEVESQIVALDEVFECAVIGVASKHTEQEIKAIVVPQPGATIDPAQLVIDLAAKLPYFMVPRYVEIVDELPKTPTQKIRKQALRDEGVNPMTWDRVTAGIEITRDS